MFIQLTTTRATSNTIKFLHSIQLSLHRLLPLALTRYMRLEIPNQPQCLPLLKPEVKAPLLTWTMYWSCRWLYVGSMQRTLTRTSHLFLWRYLSQGDYQPANNLFSQGGYSGRFVECLTRHCHEYVACAVSGANTSLKHKCC